MKWIYKGNEILILRTLNEFLKWIFMRNILRKVSYSKIKRNYFEKDNTMYETKNQAKQKKTKSPSRNFDNPKKIEVVRMEANLHYFPMASQK